MIVNHKICPDVGYGCVWTLDEGFGDGSWWTKKKKAHRSDGPDLIYFLSIILCQKIPPLFIQSRMKKGLCLSETDPKK